MTQGQCVEGAALDGGGGLRAQICTVAALSSSVAVIPEESSTSQGWRPGLVLQRERQEHRERERKNPENHSGGASGCVCSEASSHVSPRLTRR